VRNAHYFIRRKLPLPTLEWIGAVKIQMFADDHNPPHFHVTSPRGAVLVKIDDLTVLEGEIDRRDLDDAKAWAEKNRQVLSDEWERLNER
jgi:hypothetical protein